MSNSRFNLNEYLTRIGLKDEQPTPTREWLEKIAHHHVVTFPYQNRLLYSEGKKSPQNRQIPSLSRDALFDLMITNNRPAYCFQQVGLLHAVLAEIGFDVTSHLSKVILNKRDNVNDEEIAGRHDSHIVLVINIDGTNYIADNGFSEESLREPVPLTAGMHQLTNDTYLLEEFDDHWKLNTRRTNKDGESYWYSMYRFDKAEAQTNDIERAHRELYLEDNVRIRSDLLLFASVSDQKRKRVYWSRPDGNGMFSSIKSDGTIRDKKEFHSEEEVIAFATKKFSL